MDTIKCKAFLEAAGRGTFAAAAEAMGYTTPGVSHLVSALEAELGFALLYRRPRGVVLTETGQRFLPVARAFLEKEEQIYRFADEVKGLVTGTVRIRAYPTIAAYLLPPLLKAFSEACPGVELKVEEDTRFSILEDLTSGAFDVALITAVRPPACDFIPLTKDELVVALPKDHPYAKRKTFPVKDLSKERYLQGIFDADDEAADVLSLYGVGSASAGSALSNAAILGMVKEGLMTGLLYRLSTTHWEDDVAILPLSPAQSIEIGMAVRDKNILSPAVKRFVELAGELFGRDLT